MNLTKLKSSALCLLLATSPGLLPAPPAGDATAVAEAEAARKEAARIEAELQEEAAKIKADAAKMQIEIEEDVRKLKAEIEADTAKMEADMRRQAAEQTLKNGEVIAEQEIIIQKHARDATNDEVAKALEHARLALLEAGMRDEAESIERLRLRLQDPSNPDREKASDWRWSRVHRMGPKGMPGDERVGSEASGLFREVFEISRTIEEHESRLRTLDQAKARILANPGASQPELERLARAEGHLQEERINGLNRLRERSGRLTEAIDKAVQSLENAPGTESPAPRVDFLRKRLGEFRSALEKSGEDDEQFYDALRGFAIGNERTMVQFHGGPDDQPPNERMMRLEREIEILQDRLRELDMELRQLRDRPFPPPLPPFAPGAPGAREPAPGRQPASDFPPPPAPPR